MLEGGDVVGLEGGLGAGKTTFARGAVHGLGVPEDTAVTSPTFALLHQYEGRVPVAHADFYRLGGEAEVEELGVDELLEEGAVLFVEWGRKFQGVASSHGSVGGARDRLGRSLGAHACVRREPAAMRSSVPSVSGFRGEGFPVAGPWGLW